MTPNQNHLVFFSSTFDSGLATGNGVGGRKSELEGGAALGSGDVLSGAFGDVVDLVGRVADGVVAGRLRVWGCGHG